MYTPRNNKKSTHLTLLLFVKKKLNKTPNFSLTLPVISLALPQSTLISQYPALQARVPLLNVKKKTNVPEKAYDFSSSTTQFFLTA
jgi:hypothetical protein